MSQYDFGVIDAQTKSGTQLADDLNQWRDAVHSSHAGTARPSYVKAGMVWMDTTGGGTVLKLFNGTTDIVLAVLSGGNAFSGNQSIAGNLDLSGAARRITGDFSNATWNARTMFQTNVANGNTSLGVIPNGTGTRSAFALWSTADTTNSSSLEISNDGGTLTFASGKNGTGAALPMQFSVPGINVMRLTTAGGVLIGTTAPIVGDAAGRVQIQSSVSSLFQRHASAAAGKYWSAAPEPSNAYVIVNQSNVGVQLADGATSWAAVSDERLKTDFAPVENPCEKLKGVRAGTFRYETDEPSVRRAGFVAQDWQNAQPESVTEDGDGYLSLMYDQTNVLTTAAVKELIARVEALEAKAGA